MKPMDLQQFTSLMKIKGYTLVATKKHHALVDQAGKRCLIFAISHRKGAKAFVKAIYVTKAFDLPDIKN